MANEQLKEQTKLGGLNLRQETADIEDFELSKLVNLDPFQEPGSLVIRNGRTTLLQLNTTDSVRTIARHNAVRYQVAGTDAYRNGGLIVEDLSSKKKTTITAFRPLNDSAIWAFLADDAVMFKDNGSVARLWGLDLIPTPSPKVANQTGKIPGDTITEGTYTIAVTQIRFDRSVETS